MKLYDDQVNLITAVEKSMISGNKRVLMRAETGSGKTIMAANILHRAQNKRSKTWFVVPRKQLLKQTSITYNYYDLKHSYIASGKAYNSNANNFICSLQTLPKMLDRLDAPDLCIIDECFTSETLIATLSGHKSIDKVSLGDLVLTADGFGKVSGISKRKSQEIYKVLLNDKTIIRCTGNHPFLSEQGWVECRNLVRGSGVVSLQDMPRMWETFSPQANESEEKKRRNKDIFDFDGFVYKNSVLFNILFKESRKLHEMPICESVCIEEIKRNWAQTAYSWWERYWDDETSRKSFRNDGGILAPRNGDKHKNAQRLWLSLSLQNRYRKLAIKKSNRDRRIFTHSIKQERARQQERQFSFGTWVESIEVEQCGGGEIVYNLQIDGHPSYFANGILVHNCHFDFKMNNLIDWLISKGTYIIGLSATPLLANGEGMDKYYQDMACGLELRELIDLGRLSDYRYFEANPPDKSQLKSQKKGDYTKKSMEDWTDVHGQYIVGNAIDLYKNHCEGSLAIHFAPSVEESKRVAEAYNKAGIPAAHMNGETPDDLRDYIVNKFANREFKILCNVDLMTFGFDLSAQVGRDVVVETIIDGSPTKSLTRQRQKWGRGLRKKDNPATIFDLVGNAEIHNYPCTSIDWSLNGKERKARKESEREIKMRQCLNCPRCHPPAPACPHCGYIYPTQSRDIEKVDGEVVEVDKSVIRAVAKEKRMEVGKAKTVADLWAIAKERGYKAGWVYKMMSVKGIQA